MNVGGGWGPGVGKTDGCLNYGGGPYRKVDGCMNYQSRDGCMNYRSVGGCMNYEVGEEWEGRTTIHLLSPVAYSFSQAMRAA